MGEPVIEIKQLSKYYGPHRGIEEVSFQVNEGEIYGFIGPNGSGKTTTIRTLLALIHPTSGSASIFGKDCQKHQAEIARDVGYLPSEAYYYENMKVKELLAYTEALYQKDCTQRIGELVERLNLDIGRKLSELSYGNKKKAGIVAALLHSPKLIILDEPTSGLDPLIQQTFFEILREEKRRGATILFSSHVLSEVQKICDKVAILKEGSVIDVHRISELREFGYKKVDISVRGQVPEGTFVGNGIADFQMTGSNITFIYRGDVSALLEKLAGLNISDVFIHEPTLEEIFLHYYR